MKHLPVKQHPFRALHNVLWSLGLARNTGRVRPYVRLLNLSNTGYQEITGVPLHGRAVMGGMEWSWKER
jgi:hypothetical protein